MEQGIDEHRGLRERRRRVRGGPRSDHADDQGRVGRDMVQSGAGRTEGARRRAHHQGDDLDGE